MAQGATTPEKLVNILESRDDIIAALKEKGVIVPSDAKLEDLAALIYRIGAPDYSEYLSGW